MGCCFGVMLSELMMLYGWLEYDVGVFVRKIRSREEDQAKREDSSVDTYLQATYGKKHDTLVVVLCRSSKRRPVQCLPLQMPIHMCFPKS